MSRLSCICGTFSNIDQVLQVENHIVGAPCGVMDQMTSACGEANKLLAMVCQVGFCKYKLEAWLELFFWYL